MVFVSGQLPINPATGSLIDGSIVEATHQVMRNVEAILKCAGSNWDHVVKVTIQLKNISDFEAVNEVYTLLLC